MHLKGIVGYLVIRKKNDFRKNLNLFYIRFIKNEDIRRFYLLIIIGRGRGVYWAFSCSGTPKVPSKKNIITYIK